MRLIWSYPARKDLYRIAAWYGRIDPELPKVILSHVGEAPLPLLDFPELGSPTRRRGVRKWKAPKTPFILLYAVRDDRIEIRRVVHSASDWQSL